MPRFLARYRLLALTAPLFVAVAVALVLHQGCATESREVTPTLAPAPTDAAQHVESDAGAGCDSQDASFGAPSDLRCTGLYDERSSEISPSARAYEPAETQKVGDVETSRWVTIPEGAKIDTADPGAWDFPVGFKAWQEIRAAGLRVETRFLWRRAEETWVRAVYAWDEGGRATVLHEGRAHALGSSHDIPATSTCDRCHGDKPSPVLGFELVGLAVDGARGLTAAALVREGRVTAPVPTALEIPDDPSGKAAPASLWLHASCGTSCHDGRSRSLANETGLVFRLGVAGDRVTVPPRRKVHDTHIRAHLLPPIGVDTLDTRGADLVTTWLAGSRAFQ